MHFSPRQWGVTLAALALLGALPALAQPRGRTDGPEGSEYGKGGYSAARDSRFALEFNWGAAIDDERDPDDDRPPLFIGLTASLWGADWYQFDLSGAYLLNSEKWNVMVGPRFRTPFLYPVSLHAGLKAGAIIVPDDGVRFGLSPQVGADLLLGDDERILVGLAYAPDIPIGDDDVDTAHRIFMNLGYRF